MTAGATELVRHLQPVDPRRPQRGDDPVREPAVLLDLVGGRGHDRQQLLDALRRGDGRAEVSAAPGLM
jgi:hypothetical protein